MRGYLLSRLFAPLGVATLVAALFFSAAYALRSETRISRFYADALRDAAISERVTVGGRDYHVERGQVTLEGSLLSGYRTHLPLKLAYAKTLAARSPILALSGVSLDEFDAAIARLERTQERLADAQTSVIERARTSSDLYPTRFLHAAAALENTRRAFLKDGTYEDLRSYLLSERLAIVAYQSDLNRFRRGFENVVPQDVPAYATAKDIVSRESMLDALDALERGISAAMDTHLARRACLFGRTAACQARDLALPSLVERSIDASSSGVQKAQFSRDILARAGIPPQPGPFIRLSSSECVARDESPLMYAFSGISQASSAHSYRSPVFVGHVALIDISDYDDLPFYSYFASHGARYVPVRDLTYYACLDAAFDKGGVLAVENIARLARELRVSRFASGPLKEMLEDDERRLASTEVISEGDAVRYLHDARALIESASLPDDVESDLVSAWLELATRGGGTLHTLADIAAFEGTNLQLAEEGIVYDFGARYLFFVRSGFLGLFMAQNPSLIDTETRFFEANSLSEHEQPFRYVSHLDADEIEHVIEDMRMYFDTHLQGIQ